MTILSILIPSIPSRYLTLLALLEKLQKQNSDLYNNHSSLGEVHIHVDNTKSFLDGGLSIGKKRESLVRDAQGKYLCFLDDDEDIAPNYIETLVRLCNENKDVVTFRNLTKTEGYWTVIDMSLLHEDNEEATPDKIVLRRPWHVCPVRTKYAKLYEFDDINYGEDWRWFNKVLTHCQTEAKTNAIIHCYNHGAHSESDKITKHELQSKQ